MLLVELHKHMQYKCVNFSNSWPKEQGYAYHSFYDKAEQTKKISEI